MTRAIIALLFAATAHAQFFGGAGGMSWQRQAVTASGAATVITISDGTVFDVTVTAPTTITFSGATDGALFGVMVCQDAGGGHAVAWGAGITGAPTVATQGSACTPQLFMVRGATYSAAGRGASSCQPGLGDGAAAITAGAYVQSTCYNDTGAPLTIAGIRCYSDNIGASTLAVANGAGTALLTGPIPCSSTWPAGAQSATVTLAAGDFLTFTFTADGATKQTTWAVKLLQ